MKSTAELKFLLILLGCPQYRSPLSASRFDSVKGKRQICQELAHRGWSDYTREIATVKLLPAGKALLDLDLQEIALDAMALKTLQKIAQASSTVKASELTFMKAADRQGVLQALCDRGLIAGEVQPTKQAEVWLTQPGIDYLREDYHPKGTSPVISLNLLHNYLQFLRKYQTTPLAITSSTESIALTPTSDMAMNDMAIFQTIQRLDQELGTENYLPIFHLRQALPLSRDDLDQALYRLQRQDQIELGTLQEVTAYRAEEIDAGIPQITGGSLFFISMVEG